MEICGVVHNNCGWKGQNGSFAAGLVHGGPVALNLHPHFWCQWEFCPWPNQNLAPSGICVTLIFVFGLLVYRIPARTTNFVFWYFLVYNYRGGMLSLNICNEQAERPTNGHKVRINFTMEQFWADPLFASYEPDLLDHVQGQGPRPSFWALWQWTSTWVSCFKHDAYFKRTCLCPQQHSAFIQFISTWLQPAAQHQIFWRGSRYNRNFYGSTDHNTKKESADIARRGLGAV